MKKIFSIVALVGSVALTGCSTSPMLVENSKTDMRNGFHIKVSNYEKISDKKINLTFKVAEGADIGEFDWKETQEDVIDNLQSKGVELASDGRDVTIALDGYNALGSSRAGTKRHVAPQSGSIIAGTLGGSVLLAVAANTIERGIDKAAYDETKDDGENFVAQVMFTVSSKGYTSNVSMICDEAFPGAAYNAEIRTTQIMSEFFEPKK
jgi:hypothetical protein